MLNGRPDTHQFIDAKTMHADPPPPPELLPAETSWELLVSEFPGHRFLDGRTLYTLPKRLIQSIRKHAPKVLSKDDVRFEMRLRSLGGTGLYRKEPMLSNVLDGHLLDSPEFDQGTFANWQQRKSTELYNQFLGGVASDFHKPVQIQHRQKVEDTIRNDARIRLRAYLGWLVTSQDYWQEVASIRSEHRAVFDLFGEHPPLPLPSAPRDASGHPGLPAKSRATFSTLDLLGRWNLTGYTTFCIPEPCPPRLFVGDHRSDIQQDGVSIFIPWCLLQGNWMTLQRLRDYHRIRTDLKHLDGWLRDSDDLGYMRCARLADLYMYFELGLRSRYGNQVKGQIANLDRAFAAFFDLRKDVEKSSEGIRKLRQLLRNRLRGCDATTPK